MHKKLFFLVIPAAALLLLASCGSKKPDYLIGAGRDNGFVPAYRAYFSIQGDKIKKISVLKYERLTLGKESEYDFIRESTYHFYDINADTDDPAYWTYTQNEYEKELYDVDKLKADLKTIGQNITPLRDASEAFLRLWGFVRLGALQREGDRVPVQPPEGLDEGGGAGPVVLPGR